MTNWLKNYYRKGTMMTDIVERLRNNAALLKECTGDTPVVVELTEAADEIQRLRDVLKPFAQCYCSPPGECDCNNCVARDLLHGDSDG